MVFVPVDQAVDLSALARFDDHLLYAGRQRLHCERFDQELHAWFEMAITNRCVLLITSDEQHLELRSSHASSVRHLTPVHSAGQTDVRHKKID